ncbi:unnamed protein product [Urochloa humidicola]
MDPDETEREIESDAQSSFVKRRNNRRNARTWGETRKILRQNTAGMNSDTEARNLKRGYHRDSEETAHETDFASDAQGSAFCKRSKRYQVQTAFSVDAVHKIFSTFNKEKREIVQSIGFGGLLNLHPQVKFPRLLVLWLLRNMDTATGMISLPSGEKLTLTEQDVQIVLGIPQSARNVSCCYTLSSLDEYRLRHILMLKPGEDLTLELIESILLHHYGEKMTIRETEAFKAAVVLYADAYFMAPKGTKVRLNQEIFKNLTNTSSIQDLNWCGYVLEILLQSADRVQKSILSCNKSATLDGCLLFLVVFYLDNVDFGPLNLSHTLLPRIVDYPHVLVKILVRSDQQPKMASCTPEYGHNKLRKAEKVVYARNKTATNKHHTVAHDLQCKENNSSEDNLENMIKAFNDWELKVQKATNETRAAMLEYMTSCAKSREEEKQINIPEGSGTVGGFSPVALGVRLMRLIRFG